MAAGPTAVVRVYFQELKDGDLRKIQARSNDAPTGGGARDIRMPRERFDDLFRRMFPLTALRKSNKRTVTARVGNVRWQVGEKETRLDIEIWPPTDARPSEIRFAQVHKSFPSAVPDGRPYLLLMEDSSGAVWGQYTTEDDLRHGDWDERVRGPIVKCMDETPPKESVRGYIDLLAGVSYCHG